MIRKDRSGLSHITSIRLSDVAIRRVFNGMRFFKTGAKKERIHQKKRQYKERHHKQTRLQQKRRRSLFRSIQSGDVVITTCDGGRKFKTKQISATSPRQANQVSF